MGAESAADPSSYSAGWRLWVFRGIAVIFIPLLLLGLLEVGLRLGGYGFPTKFFLPNPVPGQTTVVENQNFSRRFFPAGLTRPIRSFAFSPAKPEQTLRIFVFGESAAEGDPAPPFGFARMLEVLLQDRYPAKKIQVINSAFTAINSHVILPIARECASYPADVWILYIGNNEVVGPYGAGTMLSRQAPSRAFIRSSIALRSTKIGQLLQSGWERLRSSQGPRQWQGMEMFLEQQVARDDSSLATVYEHFQRNLRGIIAAGTDSGARVLASTLGSNLRDCAPFGSLHRPNLSPEQKSQWDKEFQAGVALEKAGKFTEAAAQYERASKLDDQFADLHFRWGRCLAKLLSWDEARIHFERARDLDTLRFRADTRLNQIIRSATNGFAPGKFQLIDTEVLLAQASPHGIGNADLFLDHVHLNFEGHYLLARQIAEKLAQWFPVAPGQSLKALLSQEQCEQRLALLDSDRLKAAEEIWGRMQRPPFTHQLDHAEQEPIWTRMLEELRRRVKAENQPASSAIFSKALEVRGDDWQLHEHYALWLLNHGEKTNAIQQWREVAQLLPHRVQTYYILGSISLAEGKLDQSIQHFQQALQIRPDYADALVGVGRACMQQNRLPEAIANFERALSIQPGSAPALNQLGLALLRAGKEDEALKQFHAAARNSPQMLAAHLNVSSALLAGGKTNQAIARYEETGKLFPSNAAPLIALGTILERQAKPQEALQQYFEAVRRQPNDAQAHLALANLLSKLNRKAEAAEHLLSAKTLQSTAPSQIKVDW